jgi:hypothetical protein
MLTWKAREQILARRDSGSSVPGVSNQFFSCFFRSAAV